MCVPSPPLPERYRHPPEPTSTQHKARQVCRGPPGSARGWIDTACCAVASGDARRAEKSTERRCLWAQVRHLHCSTVQCSTRNSELPPRSCTTLSAPDCDVDIYQCTPGPAALILCAEDPNLHTQELPGGGGELHRSFLFFLLFFLSFCFGSSCACECRRWRSQRKEKKEEATADM